MATQTATTALPDLDLSTSVPVSPTPAAQSSALPELDMSTSVPAPGTTGFTGFLNKIGEGGAEAARDIYGVAKSMVPGGPAETGALKTIWNNLPPVQLADSVKQTLPLIHAYETARSSGASMSDALTKVNETAKQHMANVSQIKPIVDAFRANPTRETARALIDATAVATSLLAGGEAIAPEAEAVTAAPAAEAAAAPAAEAEAVGSPIRTKVAAPADTAAAATSKIEPAVATQTAKAGLAPGEAGMTTEAATAATKQAALDAQTTTQTNIDQTLQNIATRHATENNIVAPASGTATRDLLTANGDALVDAGKANYKILDKYTDGQFTNAQNELKNAQQELRTKAGMTDVDTGDLEANVTRAQWNVDHLFDKAVAQGMPKETADLARMQFRTGQATLDAANDVRMANKVTGAGDRTTNLNTLENRWTARYDAGRLQQAFGEQGAKDALVQLRAARETADIFQAMPPTESQALRQLITDNTVTGGKLGPTTNWKGVRTAFSKLPDRAARFSDVPKVENFINRQTLYQNFWTGAKVAGLASIAHGLGIDKFILHLMLGD
jgi:hypothetical protein